MPSSASRFFLRASRVFTATDDHVVDDGLVEVIGDRLGRVIPSSEAEDVEELHEDLVLDYGNATIMPGLVDAHCHITLTGKSPYEEQALDPDEMLALVAVNNLELHLSSGVTTIRDNGGRNRVVFAVREAVARGYIRAPRMLLAGRPLTHSYGHFYWCNGVADGVDQIRAAVRQLVAEGADHIKIMASGGGTAGNLPYYPSYNVEELRAGVDAAHALGRLTTAHCRATKSIENALDAGLDCIEHAEFLEPEGLLEFGNGVPPMARWIYAPKIAQRINETATFVGFTAQAGYSSLMSLRQIAESNQLTAHQQSKLASLDALFDMKLGVLNSMIEDGLLPRIAISTDAGPFDVTFGGLQPGVQLAVEAGMTPTQALRAVTQIPASACGLEAEVGTLEAGKAADILVVRGDATSDVSALSNVEAVYQAGRLVSPVVTTSVAEESRLNLSARGGDAAISSSGRREPSDPATAHARARSRPQGSSS